MKFKKLFFATTLMALALTSCSNDDDSINKPNDQTVNFSATIGESDFLRAAGTQWAPNDQIGIFMKQNGQDLSSGSIVDGAENIQYFTALGTGNFDPVVTSSAIKMPENGSAVDFVAYYPYQASISDYSYPINVQNQTSQEAIDLLFSNQATGKDKTNPNVTLNFKHKLSKLIFNVKAGDGVSTLEGMTTEISGLKTKASFSFIDENIVLDGNSVNNISLKSTINTTTAVSEGIVIPENNLSNIEVRFFIPNVGTFKSNLANGINFEGGKKYTFNVELKESGEAVFANFTGTIEDWVEGTTTDWSLEREDIEGEGTKDSPYIISQLSSKIGETDKWVEGYIIGVSNTTRVISSDGSTITDTNILLATKADETEASKCIAVALDEGTDIQKALNLADNPSLIGKKIKVKGTISANILGFAIGITALTDQEGGIISSDDWKVIFNETFGTATVSSRPKFGSYTGYDNISPVVFSGTGDIRSTTAFDNHAWLAVGEASLKIENISIEGYKTIRLSYDITANLFSTGSAIDVNKLKVKCDETYLEVPSFELNRADYQNAYYNVIIDNLPVSFSTLEFTSTAEDNTLGFRLDNIKIEGVQ
ncbi:MAG: fimbrillin family protein [Dysgonomonas sp.]|nr:fimbrillin family protein [Dysgonomonas sp.]